MKTSPPILSFAVHFSESDHQYFIATEKSREYWQPVPFVMPFRSLDGSEPDADDDVRKLARWCNRQNIRKSCTFSSYKRNNKKEE